MTMVVNIHTPNIIFDTKIDPVIDIIYMKSFIAKRVKRHFDIINDR